MVSKKSNVHIARQSLRSVLLQQLEGSESVKWGHQLVDFEETESDSIILKFLVDGEIKYNKKLNAIRCIMCKSHFVVLNNMLI